MYLCLISMELQIPGRAHVKYQWIYTTIRGRDEQMFDGTTQPFEWIQSRDFVQILAVQWDKIITTYEQQPWIGTFHTLIGGIIEEGHTPEQTAHKELKEEAGIIAKDLQYLATFPGIWRVQKVHFFLTRDFDGPGPQTLDPGEKIQLISLTFEELLDQMTQNDRRAGEFNLRATQQYFIHKEHEAFRKLLFG